MIAITGSVEAGGLIEPWRVAYNHNRLVIFKWVNPLFISYIITIIVLAFKVRTVSSSTRVKWPQIMFQTLKIILSFSSEFSLYRGDTFWAVFFGTLTGWTGTYCVKQTQVQRYCCMGTPSKAKKLRNQSINQLDNWFDNLLSLQNPLLEYSGSYYNRIYSHLVRNRCIRLLCELRSNIYETHRKTRSGFARYSNFIQFKLSFIKSYCLILQWKNCRDSKGYLAYLSAVFSVDLSGISRFWYSISYRITIEILHWKHSVLWFQCIGNRNVGWLLQKLL